MFQNFCAIIHQLTAITFDEELLKKLPATYKVLFWKLITIAFHKELFKKNCLQNIALEKAAWEFRSHVPMFMHTYDPRRLYPIKKATKDLIEP